MSRSIALIVLLVLTLALAAMADDATSPTLQSGVILSDGTLIEGKVSTTPGRPMRFFSDGKLTGKYAFDQIQVISFRPINQKMEQLWRFPEFGSDEKNKVGEPFPMHDLEATLKLTNGKTIVGKLATTVVYVVAADKNHKFVLESKQRGKPGQTYGDILYVKEIRTDNDDNTPPESIDVQFKIAPPAQGDKLYLLTRKTFKPLAARPDGQAAYKTSWDQDEGLYIAAGNKQTIAVGWPENNGDLDEKVIQTANKAAQDLANFFTVRDVLAVAPDPHEPQTHLIMLVALYRDKQGPWSGDPWRLSIWRWRLTPKGNVIGPPEEGVLLRIKDKAKQAPPEVKIEHAWWKQSRENQTVNVGENKE